MMSDKQTYTEKNNRYQSYEIHLIGHMDERWVEWFEGLDIVREDTGKTILTGPVVDQAALHGLLKKIRDLGLPLISVIPVDPATPNTLDTDRVDQTDDKK